VFPHDVTGVTITAEVMEVVVALEQAVVPDDPVGAFIHVGLEDLCGHGAVVLRGYRISDVVEQGGDHHLVGFTVPKCPGGALQGVPVAVDPVAEGRPPHRPECAHDLVGQVSCPVGCHLGEDQFVVLAGSIGHVHEADSFHGHGVLQVGAPGHDLTRGGR